MRICSWNVRGCNNPLKLREVMDFLKRNHIDVFGILETRIRQGKVSKALDKFMSYRVISNYQHHLNGRIWVLWNLVTVCVQVVEIHGQFIHCYVVHNSTGVFFHATFVYASNDPIARRVLWSSLHQLCGTVQEWSVLEDFNVTRDNAERISSSPSCLSDMLDFNACLLGCGLDDLNCTGCEFTWSNKHEEPNRVWCKLDRALINDPWIRKFPSSSAIFMPAGISDHSPAMVTIFEERIPKAKFSFLNC
ncbi:hypothetical protein RND81_09G092200 [Saponaria officinalis]|uniref:Endonuclease/exonuclease/phosphatase domain-containing protein n=1 Tax=Saponaria officinalis TaxID=3572 RepID=A0AAW1IKR6_SAPOF